jgi:predicted N-acetyltransferase YhbS
VGAAGSERVVVGGIDAGEHDCSAFSCGVAELDRWVRGQAVAADRREGTRVLVATVSGGRVVGCVQLTALQLEAASEGSAAVGERVAGKPIRAVLIGRLAVDRDWQRRGVASALGWQALVVAAGVAVGTHARLLVARSDGDEQSCARLGFRPLAGHPGWGFLPLQDVQATISAAEAG